MWLLSATGAGACVGIGMALIYGAGLCYPEKRYLYPLGMGLNLIGLAWAVANSHLSF